MVDLVQAHSLKSGPMVVHFFFQSSCLVLIFIKTRKVEVSIFTLGKFLVKYFCLIAHLEASKLFAKK